MIVFVENQAKLDGKAKTAAPLINKFINAYRVAQNVALMIWKLALVFVIAIGLDQIALKVCC